MTTPDPTVKGKDLETLWKLEYLISDMWNRIDRNKELGFAPKYKTLSTIIFEAKRINRAEFIRQVKSISPIAVNMLFDSLYTLSEKFGYLDFKKFSRLTTYNSYELYLTKEVFRRGRNPSDNYATNLLEVLVREGVSSDHTAVQWAQILTNPRRST